MGITQLFLLLLTISATYAYITIQIIDMLLKIHVKLYHRPLIVQFDFYVDLRYFFKTIFKLKYKSL